MKTSLLLAVLCGVPLFATAAEIKGTVRSAKDKYAEIATDSDLLPRPGDKVEIFFTIPGSTVEISVASGHVVEIVAESVAVEIDSATGTVSKDHFARFTSANPLKKSAAPVPPAPVAPRVMPPLPGSPIVPPIAPPIAPPLTPLVAPAAVPRDNRPLNFDVLNAGAFPPNAFTARGARFVAEKGEALIAVADPNMILPDGRQNVLLLGGEKVTSLTIHFAEPLRRLGVTRIGTRGGTSIPTWSLEAFDAQGKLVASTGETHGLPKTAQTFSVSGAGIVRVRLQTDNRNGNTVWATWNSLPVVEFEIER